MEWWILLGVVVIWLAAGVVTRIRRKRRDHASAEAPNIYPLW
jgi:hypothetical protein